MYRLSSAKHDPAQMEQGVELMERTVMFFLGYPQDSLPHSFMPYILRCLLYTKCCVQGYGDITVFGALNSVSFSSRTRLMLIYCKPLRTCGLHSSIRLSHVPFHYTVFADAKDRFQSTLFTISGFNAMCNQEQAIVRSITFLYLSFQTINNQWDGGGSKREF